MEREYQICTNCVMDTTDEDITFSKDGVCSHCHTFETHQKAQIQTGEVGTKLIEKKVLSIKAQGKGKEYDCIIGLSGGVDSSYVAYKVKQLGLRPLAVHVDSGWNSELAVSNIESIVNILEIDLITHVVNWPEMQDLQLSFFKASVPNCDIPQDHAFMAILYKEAAKHGISHVISGHNAATESILPSSWGHTALDSKHLNAIQKIFGKKKLKKYPRFSIFQYAFYWPYIKGIRNYRILNFMEYNKEDVKKFIMEKLDWRDYGGKHHESIFTKFFQSYYLPHKFGFDKRKAHLSSLIVSGQLTREEALQDLNKPVFDTSSIDEDKLYIAKKLGIDLAEFNQILARPKKAHNEYPTNQKTLSFLLSIKEKIRGKFNS